eukprot:CAMPEP_0176461734 /NCGR_PEP_ID=MMETSP0127-20121128/34839_1 /TAXON_ID=938130 /ORGANISM="Platyophrya macrostoma, Strain WH" /LENGTH=194 /DNA_ID=CAMNT_0017853499 /DNA_START=646 /DNA_END=1230 /DNA_ORIENTATION=-
MKAVNKKDKYEQIMEKKLATPIEFLCKGLPTEFVTFLTYCRNLRFEDKPDYAYLKTLLKDLFVKSGFEMDWSYDWNIIAQEKKKNDEGKGTMGGVQNTQGQTGGNVGSGQIEKKEEEKMAIEKEIPKTSTNRPQTGEDKLTNDATVDKRMSTISKTDKSNQLSSKPSLPTNQMGSNPMPQAYSGPKIVVTKGGR